MKVEIYNLEDPTRNFGFFFKTIEIKREDDFFQIAGFISDYIYMEVIDVQPDDDPILVKRVKTFVTTHYPFTAQQAIDRLFKMVKIAVAIGRKMEGR
jgi:hypothetical protein